MENMEVLGKCMNQLPKIVNLTLDFYQDDLGRNALNMKYLVDGLKLLRNNLKELVLNLSENNLGVREENMRYLGQIMG